MLGFEFSLLQITLSVIAIICYIAYCYFTSTFNYWHDRGVKYVKPYPFVGSIWKLVSIQEHLLEFNQRVYKKFQGEPYVGIYEGRTPTLMVLDHKLIKNIFIKDFQHFTDHGFKINEEADPIQAKNLFNMEGHRWKEMRTKLTPTFTSGRMRAMFPLVLECAEQLEQKLHESNGKMFEAKEILSRYTTDVIGSCAFGVKCNSLKDPNCEFRVMGRKLVELDFWGAVKSALIVFFPTLATALKLSFIDKVTTNFFRTLVSKVIASRSETGVVRKDFIQLLIEIKEKGRITDQEEDLKQASEDTANLQANVPSIKWTDDDITAQAAVFFLAGFETSSALLSFALLELAMNPEVQEKAYRDIDDAILKYDGKITYQSVQEMHYLDAILQESMRKYPPVVSLLRICTKTYAVPDSNLKIEKGIQLFVPTHALQNDERYFPEPDKFKPERFSNDETSQKNQCIYTPFGEGPRQCIGNRFAMMQSKLALVTILHKFRVQACPRTEYPIKLDPKQFILTAKSGIWVTTSPRN